MTGASASTGTASTTVTLSTGQYGSEAYQILVRMTGNYTNEAQAVSGKTAVVVVTKPATTNELTGGGTISQESPGLAGGHVRE